MGMREELKAILEMVANATVSVGDGTRLLAAVGMEDAESSKVQDILTKVHAGTLSVEEVLDRLSGAEAAGPPETSGTRGKYLRIRVERDGKKTVNIRIPIGLVDTGVHLFGGASMRVDGLPIDTQKLWDTVRTASAGKIIDIDGDDGEHVEIAVE
jgi:hypothetical protein